MCDKACLHANGRTQGCVHARGSVADGACVQEGGSEPHVRSQEDRGATVTLPSAARNLRVISSTPFALTFTWEPHPAADTFQVGCMETAQLCVLAYAARSMRLLLACTVTKAHNDASQVLFARPLREGEDMNSAPPFRPAAPETSLSSLTVAGLLTDVEYRFKVSTRVQSTLPTFRPLLCAAPTPNTRRPNLNSLNSQHQVVSKVRGITPFDILGSNVLQAAPSGLPLPPASVRVIATWSSQVQLEWTPATFGPRPQRYRVAYARVNFNGENVEAFGRPLETVDTSTTITGLGAILEDLGSLGAAGLQFKVFAGSHKEFETAGRKVKLILVSPIGPARGVSLRGASSVPTWGAVAISLTWLPPPDGVQPHAYRITVTQTVAGSGDGVGVVAGAVFDLADVLHIGARHSLQSGLVGPLTEGQIYSFSVHSKSVKGFYEPAGTSAVLAAPTVVPSNLTIKACAATAITVSWDFPAMPNDESGKGLARCPQGRILFTQRGSVVTGIHVHASVLQHYHVNVLVSRACVCAFAALVLRLPLNVCACCAVLACDDELVGVG